MKVLEVKGRFGSRHGGAKKFKMLRVLMFVQELWKGSTLILIETPSVRGCRFYGQKYILLIIICEI